MFEAARKYRMRLQLDLICYIKKPNSVCIFKEVDRDVSEPVQHGSCLSSLFFIIVMDEIIKAGKRKDQKTNALVLADEVMTWGESETEVPN